MTARGCAQPRPGCVLRYWTVMLLRARHLAPIAAAMLAACFSEQVDEDEGGESASTTAGTSSSSAASTNGSDGTSTTGDSNGTSTGTTVTGDPSSSEVGDPDSTGAPVSFCDELGDMIGSDPVVTCVDFDDGSARDNWTTLLSADGMVRFDVPEGEPPPPHPPAMGASVPPDDLPANAAGITRSLRVLSLPLRLEFAFLVETCVADVRLVELSFPGEQTYEVFLQATPSGVQLGIATPLSDATLYPLDGDVLANTAPWSRWRIATDPISGYVDVFVDDTRAAQVVGLPPMPDLQDPPTLRVGALDGDVAGCAVWFDDIVAF